MNKTLDDDNPWHGWFARRTLVFIVAALGAVLTVMLLWRVRDLLPLVFGGALAAVALRRVGKVLSRHLPIPENWAWVVVAAVVTIAGVAFTWSFGQQMSNQFSEIISRIPTSMEQIAGWLQERTWGQVLLANSRDVWEYLSSTSAAQNAWGTITSSFFVVAGLGLIFVLSLYFAASPHLYVDGAIALVPPRRRARARALADELADTLSSWLIGRFSSMAIVGLLTGVGLWVAGVDLAFSLGLVAALLAFIPNIGPFLAGVLIMLVAMSQGTTTMAWALGVYVAAQALETAVLTPLLQQHFVALPPVLTLLAQLILGLFTGVLGLVFATPVVAVVRLLIQRLYVEDFLEGGRQAPGSSAESPPAPEPTAESGAAPAPA